MSEVMRGAGTPGTDRTGTPLLEVRDLKVTFAGRIGMIASLRGKEGLLSRAVDGDRVRSNPWTLVGRSDKAAPLGWYPANAAARSLWSPTPARPSAAASDPTHRPGEEPDSER